MQEYEEISLRDLILVLLRGWKIIIATTVVILVISIGVFFTMNSTTYTVSTQARLTFNPEYISKFGPYALPQTKAEDFIMLLKEDTFIDHLSDLTEIDQDKLKAIFILTPINIFDFTINVTSGNTEELKVVMNALKNSSKDYINYSVSKKMFTTFDTSYITKLDVIERATSDKQRMLSYFENELLNTNPLLNNNVVNPVFSSLSSHLVQTKATIAELDFTTKEIKDFKLETEKNIKYLSSFENYIKNRSIIESPQIELDFNDNIQSESQRFSARTFFPVSIILGVMLGVFIVFFKNYWTNSANR